MVPAEKKISGKLKKHFHEIGAQPHQLLREFQRFVDHVCELQKLNCYWLFLNTVDRILEKDWMVNPLNPET